MRFILAIFCLVSSTVCLCQTQTQIDSSITTAIDKIQHIPGKTYQKIEEKYQRLSDAVKKQNQKLLVKMKLQESAIQSKLADSSKLQELFTKSQAQYQELQDKIQAPITAASTRLKEYIPGLDSINTLLKFISPANSAVADKAGQISALTGSVQELQGRLQQANELQSFIRERETLLKTALTNAGVTKQLLGLNKQVYYYQEKIKAYKVLLKDKKKMEEKILSTVRALPAFQNFFQKYSYFAQLFPSPPGEGTPEALEGLQTRTQLQQDLAQRFSGVTNNSEQFLQGQMQEVQGQLNTLKDKISRMGGGSSEMTMPDFKPNREKTKSFLKRLEYGLNMQNTKGTSFLPAITDFALTIGYKIDEKKSIGLGTSFKMGWGNGWNNIKITSEGVGFRGYADIKFKGSVWITGGYEYNYLQRFTTYAEIKNLDVWQQSALLGVSKKYKINSRLKGNFQLLYDFLYYKQVPASQPLKFRIGWTL